MAGRTRTNLWELRDYHGRLVEVGAPCEVRYYGTWHRGRVVSVGRKRIWVKVVYPRPGRADATPRPPAWVAVLGPTREDVERTLPPESTLYDRTKSPPPHPKGA